MAKISGSTRSTTSRRTARRSSPRLQGQWDQPDLGWIPVAPAVVRFGIADSDRFKTSDSAPLSRETEEFVVRGKQFPVEMASRAPEPLSLEGLTKLLQDKTHARKIEIDQQNGHFYFSFDLPHGGASTWVSTPWVTLAAPDEPLRMSAKIEAEALFNKEGFVRVSEEQANYNTQQNKDVREAIGLVWRRLMLPSFDRLVAMRRVEIFGRVGTAVAPFQRLPRDLWTILDVLDWQHGIARDPEGVMYYSLHAIGNDAPVKALKIIVADETTAKNALAQKLRLDTEMKRDDALSWLKSEKFRISGRRFQNHVWPQAREAAGLAPQAPPGRKKKSRL